MLSCNQSAGGPVGMQLAIIVCVTLVAAPVVVKPNFDYGIACVTLSRTKISPKLTWLGYLPCGLGKLHTYLHTYIYMYSVGMYVPR